MSAFSLENVRVQYGSHYALDGVTLDIPKGSRVCLLGPSGGGKTTLLRLLNGMATATSGSVALDSRPASQLTSGEWRAFRSTVGFIHQHLALVPSLRVFQNVLSGRMGQRGLWRSLREMLFPSRADRLAVHALLARVGIAEKLYHHTHRLSGGQRQRVAIARALFQSPTALLADEPVSSIDPARARHTVELLTRLSREDGLTLVMSLHHADLACEFFPRIIGLRAGRVCFDGPPEQLTPDLRAQLYELDEANLDSLLQTGD